jgi:hypothetical protein
VAVQSCFALNKKQMQVLLDHPQRHWIDKYWLDKTMAAQFLRVQE